MNTDHSKPSPFASLLTQCLMAMLTLSVTTLCAKAQIDYTAKTIRIQGSCAEIGGYAPQQRLLVATNAEDETIDLYQVRHLKTNPTIEVVQRIDVEDMEPTSVAVHPQRPLAFATVLADGSHDRPGQLYVVSLESLDRSAARSTKQIVYRQPLPPGPDCICIAPDGRCALIAIEAEEDPDTPGAILSVDLSNLDDVLAGNGTLNVKPIVGLDKALGIPLGRIEPEFISISPDGKLAAVSCQENDAVVLIDMHTTRIAGVIRLTPQADPDGVCITGPTSFQGEKGYVVIAAEEGRNDPRTNRRGGQCVSVFFVPADAPNAPQPLARLDVRKPLHASSHKRCDPEGVAMFTLAGQPFAMIGLERKNKALLMDMTDPSKPRFLHTIDVGQRPEGLFPIPLGPGRLCAAVFNEGNGDNGSITFIQLRDTKHETAKK